MLTPIALETGRHRRLLLILVTVLLSVGVVLVVAQFPDRILAGDPPAYRERVAAMLEGGLPYFDVPFEHLPVMLLPMLAAWFLGGAASQPLYVIVFAALMAMAMAATAVILDRSGEAVGDNGAGWRWVVVTAPLLPLVLFRNDPVSVLLAAAALLLFLGDSGRWSVWASVGAFAKVWPAALAVAAWRRRRTASLAVGAAGALSLAITYLPGFVEQRAGFGIHAETVMGALVGLVRTLSGRPAEVTLTTAAYIDVAGWVTVVNALGGLAVAGLGMVAVLGSGPPRVKVVTLGTVVVGIILTSSLFSLQYVLWILPFLVLSRQKAAAPLGLVLTVLTLALVWAWDEALVDNPLFYLGFTVRNVLVVGAALLLAREASAAPAG